MEYGILAEDIERIMSVFSAFPEVKQVILFGSRAMGTYKPGSDIDLAIEGNALTFSDMLDISARLEQLGLLYRFDLQNLAAIRDPDVLAHIHRVGKVLYNRGSTRTFPPLLPSPPTTVED
jgi:uncharacterized protein